ncbi:MAG TPA: hypothetical protein VHO24_02535 [Opitutaceae bacterium]|nr:hypothetical protein [Opitutaceae bacterium]
MKPLIENFPAPRLVRALNRIAAKNPRAVVIARHGSMGRPENKKTAAGCGGFDQLTGTFTGRHDEAKITSATCASYGDSTSSAFCACACSSSTDVSF